MKKVILKKPELDVRYIEDLAEDALVGIEFKSSKRLAITQVNSKKWIALNVGYNGYNSGCYPVTGTSIKDYISNIISPFSLFEFEDRDELLEWLKESK